MSPLILSIAVFMLLIAVAQGVEAHPLWVDCRCNPNAPGPMPLCCGPYARAGHGPELTSTTSSMPKDTDAMEASQTCPSTRAKDMLAGAGLMLAGNVCLAVIYRFCMKRKRPAYGSIALEAVQSS